MSVLAVIVLLGLAVVLSSASTYMLARHKFNKIESSVDTAVNQDDSNEEEDADEEILSEDVLQSDVADESPIWNILVVESNPGIRTVLAESLADEFAISAVSDCNLVFGTFEERFPDLVIVDIRTPMIDDGYVLCSRLKSNVETSHIPVIMLAALNDKNSILRGLESGADDYILRPLDIDVLRSRIRSIITDRQALRKAVNSGTGDNPEQYPNRLDRKFMDKVVEIAEREISNPDFVINLFCVEIGMSRTAFYNKLLFLTGQGPNEFIRTYRLNRAKQILERGEHTIGETADMVGFSDAKYFSVCFKKQFGVSPSKILPRTASSKKDN
ncbi:MAG: helix-turn-helix domain-containing protein [Bacteroidales bacterium]|nr:helix-turn-helix domain-containing protein [Bacteroidales bacterium]